MTKKRLGELLLQEGLINDEQLEIGLEEQKQTGELIGEILVRKGYVNESDVARTISMQFSFPYLSVSHYYIAPEMRSLFSLETLEKYCFVPIDRFADVLGIVIAGLLDQDIMDEIEKQTGCTIQVYVGKVSEVKQVIREKFSTTTPDTKAPVETGKQAAVDVTAPPAAKVAKKKRAPDEEEPEEDLAEAVTAVDDDGADMKDDAQVVEELEQQFKKFRFFDEEKKPEADE